MKISILISTNIIKAYYHWCFLCFIVPVNYIEELLWFLLVGYILVDIYGMADNTYHMYYYMIAISIIMACIDSDNYYNNKEIDYMKLF